MPPIPAAIRIDSSSVARETGEWVALRVPQAPGAIVRHQLGQQEALFTIVATGIVGGAEQAGALHGRRRAIVAFRLDPARRGWRGWDGCRDGGAHGRLDGCLDG